MEIKGIVMKGSKQAQEKFAIKTANIYTLNSMEQGIFVSEADLHGHKFHGVCFIGHAHLIKGVPWRIEVYLLDYNGPEFYGEEIVVNLKKKIRDVAEFTSEEQAKKYIENDIREARAYFAK